MQVHWKPSCSLDLHHSRYHRHLPDRQKLRPVSNCTAAVPNMKRSYPLCLNLLSHPNYGLLATVLGVRPAEPGFRSVRIEPSLGNLKRAEGRIPHPLGDIEVLLERRDEGGLRASITLPSGLTGELVWNSEEAPIADGRQKLDF